MAPSDSPEDADVPQPPHKRRARYRGTHPRKFAERYKELSPEAYPGVAEHVRAQGRTPAGTHVPVLAAEVMEALQPRPGEVVADCTLGYGGHAREFLRRVLPGGRLIGFDVDAAELERTRGGLAEFGAGVTVHRSNFAGIGNTLHADGLAGYDIVFADLGVSSMQIDNPARGFSYKHDGPLDMRMDDRRGRTAADLLGTLSAGELSEALRTLGDEPDHERIADRIVAARERRPLTNSGELVRLILAAKGISPRDAGGPGLHPAARTFQALRMLVNDELATLAQLLRAAPYCLRSGGRIGLIAFHGGEERLILDAFRDGLREGWYSAVSEEAIRPGTVERRDNPRSASAVFWWARRGD